MRGLGLGVAGTMLGVLVSAGTAAALDGNALQQKLHAASVTIGAPHCSGVLAEGPDLVLTAAHCVRDAPTATIRFSTGARRTGWVVETDATSDQALLILEDPVEGIEPLTLARRRQIPGTVLYFEGRPDRAGFQTLRLDRVGQCPSLPRLPNALFTSVRGTPGDSGAPLVDRSGRIVGLVHGGARCHIATPADSLVRLIDRALAPDEPPLVRHTATPCETGTVCRTAP